MGCRGQGKRGGVKLPLDQSLEKQGERVGAGSSIREGTGSGGARTTGKVQCWSDLVTGLGVQCQGTACARGRWGVGRDDRSRLGNQGRLCWGRPAPTVERKQGCCRHPGPWLEATLAVVVRGKGLWRI